MKEEETYYEFLVKEHVKKFGVEPVITGMMFEESGSIVERMEEALKTGVPYVEQNVPDGAII